MGNKAGPTAVGAGGGALSGALAGAQLGSIVPGIGTAIGAGVGAIFGGVGGGLFANKGGFSPTPAPALPADPNLATEQARAQSDQIKALQVQVQGDSASLMARYGARLALAGTTPVAH